MPSYLKSIFRSLLITGSVIGTQMVHAQTNPFGINAYVLYEHKSKQQLAGSDANHKISTPINKLMLALLVLEDIRTEQITWNDHIIANQTHNLGNPPLQFLPAFKRIGIKNLLELLFASCANNIAAIIAEKLSLDQKALLVRMNNRAQELGLTNTRFYDVIGQTSANHTSLQDIFSLSKYLYNKFPKNRYLYNKKKIQYAGLTISNGNGLLWRTIDANGMLYCQLPSNDQLLIAFTKNKTSNFMLISVGPLPYNKLMEVATQYLNTVNDSYTTFRLFSQGEPLRKIPLYGSDKSSLTIGPREDVYYAVAKKHIKEDGDSNIVITLSHPDRIWAPVIRNQAIGSLNITLPQVFTAAQSTTIPLISLSPADQVNFIRRWYDVITLALTL